MADQRIDVKGKSQAEIIQYLRQQGIHNLDDLVSQGLQQVQQSSSSAQGQAQGLTAAAPASEAAWGFVTNKYVLFGTD